MLLKSRPNKAHRGPPTPGPHFEAFVHFQGWSKRQDSWVHCSRVRPRMIGTDSSGADWIRNSVSNAAIKPGLLIEVRMVPQWVPAEILGPDPAGEPGSFLARLGTDGTELNVTPDEIIKRWPIPLTPSHAAVAAAAREAATVGQRLRMKYETEGVAEWFGGKVQAVKVGGKTVDIAFVRPMRIPLTLFAMFLCVTVLRSCHRMTGVSRLTSVLQTLTLSWSGKRIRPLDQLSQNRRNL